MGDAGGIIGIRARDVLEIPGETGIAGIDIGEDGLAIASRRFFRNPTEQCGFAGLATSGGENDLLFVLESMPVSIPGSGSTCGARSAKLTSFPAYRAAPGLNGTKSFGLFEFEASASDLRSAMNALPSVSSLKHVFGFRRFLPFPRL